MIFIQTVLAICRLIFKIKEIPEEYFPYLGVLKNLFCNLDTEHYSYGELCNEINLVTGENFRGTE